MRYNILSHINVSKKIANSDRNYHLTFHKMQVKLELVPVNLAIFGDD